ncbi:hypothetical protein NHF50_00160 [Flavobacterium sp. NRK F10]|uniref:hypothetical protein n=1 Tax=Flavobacterium sp. NRK F10 TaxID=2954931 RepID=UPI0020900B5A|nr:hypothetical protein [Flavobacterium sp. NRK F10]MCO6173448.1 hypothetical protein [Flavobacterium sp. NRK F10]
MEYYFVNKEELVAEDSSLSLGWFKINKVEIVENTYCILTISLSDLINGLVSLNDKKNNFFRWCPCDSGEVLLLEKKNNEVVIKYKEKEIIKSFKSLYEEVLELGSNLLIELEKKRKESVLEAAFIDLNRTIREAGSLP